MSSDVEIANRALQLVGASRIVSLADDSVSARAVNNCYAVVRRRELRMHPWNFSIKRAALAADATDPAFGPANQYPLPSDFLCLRARDPLDELNTKDWKIEGRSILTDDSAPLNIRYTYDVADENQMDGAFREVLAHAVALAICEELTQSNTKKDGLRVDYDLLIREAKRTNAIENVPQEPVEDSWITARA